MLLLAAALALAAAHSDTESVATFELAPDAVRIAFSFDTARIMEVAQAKPSAGDDWSDEDAAGIAERAAAYVQSHWQLTADGAAVPLTFEGVRLVALVDPVIGVARNTRIELRFRAPPLRDAAAELVETLLEDLEPTHHHFVVLKGPGGTTIQEIAAVNGLRCRFFIPDVAEGAAGRRLRARVVTGARAAVGEPWLAALLLALLVAPLPRRERFTSLVAAVAAAALAFGATRAGWISPAPWAARAAAAFAVGYVAVENWKSDVVKLRVATAALFGLVEGMALAPLALVAGRTTGAAEGVAFVAAALVVATIVAIALAAVVGLGGWTRNERGPTARVKAAHAVLLLVGVAGVALALWTKVRGA